MTKSVLNKILDFEADETTKSALEQISRYLAEGQAGDTPQPTQALTLDERSNLYLNAVHGSRDFTSDEYTTAREIVLNAMAANFMGRPKSDVDLHDFNLPVDSETEHISSEIQYLLDDVSAASRTKVMPQSHAIASSIPHPMNRGSQSLEPLFRISEPDLQSSTRATPVRKESKSRRTRLGFYGSIAATISLLITSSAVLFLLFSGSKQNNTFADLPLEQLKGIQSERIQEATSMKRNADGAGGAQRLLELGNRLITSGDLYGGRLVLVEAADEGSALAALNLGSSFDPSEETSIKNGDSDLEKAKFWYLRAKQLGEQNAQARLDKLNSLTSPR